MTQIVRPIVASVTAGLGGPRSQGRVGFGPVVDPVRRNGPHGSLLSGWTVTGTGVAGAIDGTADGAAEVILSEGAADGSEPQAATRSAATRISASGIRRARISPIAMPFSVNPGGPSHPVSP